jgi:hypothetical protein
VYDLHHLVVPSTSVTLPEAYELGLKFTSDRAGYISAVRFYKVAGNTGPHSASLWSLDGKLLASAQFMNETASGWQQASFGTGVSIAANVTYVASYHSTHGPYAREDGMFANNNTVTNGPLTALMGTYAQGNSRAPLDGDNANYWIDPVFNDSRTSGVDLTGPANVGMVSMFAPGDMPTMSYGQGSFELGMRFRSARDGYITALSYYKLPQTNGVHVGSLWSANGTLLGRVTFPDYQLDQQDGIAWQSVPLPVSVPVVAHEEYVVSYHTDTGFAYSPSYFATPRFYSESEYILYATANGAGGNGLYGPAGVMPTASTGDNYWADVEWNSTPNPAVSEADGTGTGLWGDSIAPPMIVTDTAPTEVGVRFQSARAGYIQGLRFYKGAANTGEHLGNLWTTDGQLLASATFTTETGSGWQEVTFAQSVPISANTTYVASYHTSSGAFAMTEGYFQSFPAAAAPLKTVGAGVYRHGPSGFPTSTYANSNFWVDVKFGNAPAPGLKPVLHTTIWPDTTQPTNPSNSNSSYLQLGVKVRSNRDGLIEGLHYFNGDANPTSHTARLWTRTGTVVASQTFTNEPTIGWQYVYFTTPVNVAANTTYVMSYDTTGAFPDTGNGLITPAASASPAIRALAHGEDGGNAVYRFGAGFPTDSYGNNHFVDVIFSSDLPIAQLASPVSVSGITYLDVPDTELGGDTESATMNFQNISVYPQKITLDGSVTYGGP